jgi:hypothetical protein
VLFLNGCKRAVLPQRSRRGQEFQAVVGLEQDLGQRALLEKLLRLVCRMQPEEEQDIAGPGIEVPDAHAAAGLGEGQPQVDDDAGFADTVPAAGHRNDGPRSLSRGSLRSGVGQGHGATVCHQGYSWTGDIARKTFRYVDASRSGTVSPDEPEAGFATPRCISPGSIPERGQLARCSLGL